MDAPELREGERSETFRNGGASIPTMAPVAGIVDPEVESKARRRQFSATYKRRILDEADKGGPGAIASLLRREGLYTSHLTTCRRAAGIGRARRPGTAQAGQEACSEEPACRRSPPVGAGKPTPAKTASAGRDHHRCPKKTLRCTGSDGSPDRAERGRRMIACQELSRDVGTVAACQSLDIARPTYYRRLGARHDQASSRPAASSQCRRTRGNPGCAAFRQVRG